MFPSSTLFSSDSPLIVTSIVCLATLSSVHLSRQGFGSGRSSRSCFGGRLGFSCGLYPTLSLSFQAMLMGSGWPGSVVIRSNPRSQPGVPIGSFMGIGILCISKQSLLEATLSHDRGPESLSHSHGNRGHDTSSSIRQANCGDQQRYDHAPYAGRHPPGQ